MTPKDYIALVALFISCVSLFLSFRTGRFTKRAKLAEIRANYLAKISEASLLLTRLRIAHRRLLDLAEDHGDEKIIVNLDMPDINLLEKDLIELFEVNSDLPLADAIGRYEKSQHKVQQICDILRGLEDRLNLSLQRYVNLRTKV